jgi:phage terminase large subunit-like protein
MTATVHGSDRILSDDLDHPPPSLPSETMHPLPGGYPGLLVLANDLGVPLAPYLRRIARLYFGPSREIVAILPRGNWKTSLAALIGVHHLLTVPGAIVTVGAASRDQARIAFERMRGFAEHPALAGRLIVRHLELRELDAGGVLRVIPSDGPRAHGLSSTLYIGDELWSWHPAGELLEAMQTGLVKRPDSKFFGISTPAARMDGPLGRLRTRALAQSDVRRRGMVIEARGELAWLEWSLPEDASVENMRAVKRCNPAPYISQADLARQSRAVPPAAFAQFHAGRWGVGDGAWLPAGAWQACAGHPEIPDGAEVWAGVDIGGSRAASAVAIVTAELDCQVRTWQGDSAVLDVADYMVELAGRFTLREVAYDPWRFRSEALRLQDRGLPMIEFPQSTTRMVPASERLYSAIIERRLTHPDDPELNAHVAAAIARQTSRGWRLDKAREADQVDAVVALAMAVDIASEPRPAAEFLGWL